MLAVHTFARRRRFSLVALLTLVVSILLHLALLRSVTRGEAERATLLPTTPVIVQLQPAPAAEAAPPKPAPKPKPKPRTVRKARPVPPPPPAPKVVAESEPAASTSSDDPVPADPASDSNAIAATSGPAADTAPAQQAEPAEPAPQAKPAPAAHALPPPSALLNYSVHAKRSDGDYQGSGSIRFTRNEDSYSVEGEIKLLFMSLLTFQSSGQIESQGLAPVLYTEKRFRKSATNTHFQRDPQLVSFSASTISYARSGMEQDRASIVWQLAALGRGDAAQLAPGAELAVFVAGTRDGDTWHLQVTGEEEIQAAGQTLRAVHVLRQPRPGSYDQKLDIWLAPGLQWYPVKLRFTEANGDVLDLSLNDAQQTPNGN